MNRWVKRGLISLILLPAACGQLNRDLGIAGREPGEIACGGFIELSGSGMLGMLGQTMGSNAFSLSMNCGPGAYIRQGPPTQGTKP